MKRIVFTFPGIGSQHTGMFDALQGTAISRDMVRLLDAAEALSGLRLGEIAQTGPDTVLNDIRVAHPLMFLADWFWGSALIASGVTPDYLAGHGVGEFVALAHAGVISPGAGLNLVIQRSRLMVEATKDSDGGMAAVLGMGAVDVSRVIESVGGVWIAYDNASSQVVISGAHAGIDLACTLLLDAGARRIVTLGGEGAFHSPMMQSAGDAFSAILAETEFSDGYIPVLSNTDPTPSTDRTRLKTCLSEQMTGTVRWSETLAYLSSVAPVVAVEAGPGSVLTGFTHKFPGVDGFSIAHDTLDGITRDLELQ